jgi:VCBS repeat-containing protein
VLTLSGSDSVANYQQVLRTVTYDNLQDPATGMSRTITFVANDGVVDSNIGTTSMSINAAPNQSPTADAGGPYLISEGDALDLVGNASSDPDLDTLTYAWDLDNDGNFGEVGEPTTETPTVSWATLVSFGIDDDPGSPFTIGVQIVNGNGGMDTATTTLTVNNVNPTGNADGGAAFTTNEDIAFTTGSVLTNDTDPNSLDVLSVTGLDVTGTTGLVVNNNDGTFDYDPNGQFESLAQGQQTTDTFSYAVSDDDAGSGASTVTITIDGANDAPTDISLDNLAASEDAAGAVVGNLTTTDVDMGDTHSYLVDDTRFEVVGSQLKLKAAQSLDFETEQTVNVTVTSTDSQTAAFNKAFVLSVTDVNDVAPVIDPAQSFGIAEDIANLTVVGVVIASDDDTTGEPRQNWMITGGDPAGVFAINGVTGQITIANNSTLDFETAPTSYTLSVTTSDGTNTSAVETVTIDLTDVNDNTPVVDPAQSFSVSETATNGTLLGTVTASDADVGTTFSSWTIAGGDPAGVFAINSGTGVLTVADNSNLDFETMTGFVLSITVSDGTNTSVIETVSIGVTNKNDNAPVSNPDSYSVDEGAILNVTVTAGVLANDSDADGNSLTALLVSGTSNGSLMLQSDGSFVYTPDAEFVGVDSFVYQPFDGNVVGAARTVQLNVVQNAAAPPPADTGTTTESTQDDSGSDSESDSESETDQVDSETTDAVTGNAQDYGSTNEQGSAVSPGNETADDEGDEVFAAGMSPDANSSATFFTDTSGRLELREAASARTSGTTEATFSGPSDEVEVSFADSLRFDGEDLSYLVGTEFIQELEQVEDEFDFDGAIPEWATGSVVTTSASISVGYIMWMLRGGYVLASVMSTLPVWQHIDPLPVLAALDDEDDESLESMIDNASDRSDDSESRSDAETDLENTREDRTV